MRYVTRGLTVGIIVLAGCRENTPVQPQQPPSIQALIVDGAHSGNKNFFFLPPLVPNPVGSPNFVAGQFNPKLAPVVEVCELTGDPSLATLTNPVDCKSPTDRVFGPAGMALDAPNEQYTLNWDTKASALVPTSFYRIIVRGARLGTPLGFLDLDPVVGGMKNVKTGDIFVFQDGRTLPIKVRIQQGAFGSTNSNDFVEQVVPIVIPSGTLDVTTNTGFAGARFTSGWLNPNLGIDQVVVIIERSGANCLNSGLQEMEGCYRFRTDPDLHLIEGALPFAQNVIAGVCFQIPVDIGVVGPPFELTRREELNGAPSGPLTRLQEVPAPFIHCDTFGPTVATIGAAFRSGRLGDIATASWQAVAGTIARVIQPTALHAVDLGAGGSTDGMSFFGYARFALMAVTSGQGATAPAGSTVPASVQVQNSHHGVTSPVVGQLVTFTVTGGGGSVSTGGCLAGNSCAAPTGTDGIATVSWQLGAGVNTLQVTTTQVTNSPQTVTATGTGATQPVLAYRHSEQYSVDAALWDRYRVTVTNRSSFPASIFAPAPDLPPCGLNTNSSQSWVDIFDAGTNARLNGFCALSSPDELNDIWFAVPRWTQPPAAVYITITDRRANVVYTSNTIQLFGPLFVNFPRQVELDWSPVAGAASYEIEMQFCESWGSPDWRTCNLAWQPWTHLLSYTAGVSYVNTFVGDQPGRWHVRAKDANGNPISAFTDFKYFTYITGPNAP